jgi:hypothetical protein
MKLVVMCKCSICMETLGKWSFIRGLYFQNHDCELCTVKMHTFNIYVLNSVAYEACPVQHTTIFEWLIIFLLPFLLYIC